MIAFMALVIAGATERTIPLGLTDISIPWLTSSNFCTNIVLLAMTMQCCALCPSPIEPVRPVTEASSESAQATSASTAQLHTAHSDPSVVGETAHCCCCLNDDDQFAYKFAIT